MILILEFYEEGKVVYNSNFYLVFVCECDYKLYREKGGSIITAS